MTTGAGLADEAARHFVGYRDGDRSALERLVRLLSPTLWHLARGCGLARDDAEDVVQAVWLQLVAKAETVRSPQAILAWLGTAVRREAWRVSRSRGRDAGFAEPPDAPDPSPGPGESALLGETARVLWRHFAELSPRCQALLRVVSMGGPPDYDAISEALGMPKGSIGPTRGRCLATLREALTTDPTWSAS